MPTGIPSTLCPINRSTATASRPSAYSRVRKRRSPKSLALLKKIVAFIEEHGILAANQEMITGVEHPVRAHIEPEHEPNTPVANRATRRSTKQGREVTHGPASDGAFLLLAKLDMLPGLPKH